MSGLEVITGINVALAVVLLLLVIRQANLNKQVRQRESRLKEQEARMMSVLVDLAKKGLE